MALILVVPVYFFSGCHRFRRPDIGPKADWLFVQTDDGFFRIKWPLVNRQNVFHFGQVFGVHFRDAPHFFPATA